MNKINYKCPICNGTGKIEQPSLRKKEWNDAVKLAAKTLLENGYSIRQVQKLLGFGSTRTVAIIRKSII